MRHFDVFSLALISSLLASQVVADPLDDAIALFRRQNPPLTTGGSGTSESTTDETTSEPTTSPTTAPTTSAEPTTAPSTTTLLTTSTSTSSETNDEETPQTSEESSETSATSLTRIQSSITSQVLISFTTVTNGQTRIGTSTSETVIPTQTDVDPASLSGGSSGGESSGLSDGTKKTIGGVVGGIGGALLLAGLGYTAWRIWGKKKHLHDEDAFDPNLGQDKLSSSTADNSTSSPFNRTLDQYHQPGPVNQASNF